MAYLIDGTSCVGKPTVVEKPVKNQEYCPSRKDYDRNKKTEEADKLLPFLCGYGSGIL